MIPQKDQILEWTENPVTLYLYGLIEKELDTFEQRDMFFRGEPQKTQEALLEMIAEVSALQRVQIALEGDFSEFSSEDESEPE